MIIHEAMRPNGDGGRWWDRADKYSQLVHPTRAVSMPARYSKLEVRTIVELTRR